MHDYTHGGFNAFQAGIFILNIDVMAVGHMHNGMHVILYIRMCDCATVGLRIFQFPLPFYFTAYNYAHTLDTLPVLYTVPTPSLVHQPHTFAIVILCNTAMMKVGAGVGD